jgi:hypothetical protein
LINSFLKKIKKIGKCMTANHRLSTKSRYSGIHQTQIPHNKQAEEAKTRPWGHFFRNLLKKKAKREEDTRSADKQAEMESHQSPNPLKFLQFRLG